MRLERRLLAFAVAFFLILLNPTACLPIDSVSPSAPSDDAPDVTLTIQTKKLIALVDERFLSMSVDPAQLIRHALPGPGAVRMMAMAAAMSPAYLRVAGPSTESSGFQGGPVAVGNELTVTEEQWSQLQVLCRNTGLWPIIGLSAHRRPGGGSRWDSRDAMRALSAADNAALAPVGWQLGYDWQTLRTAGVQPSQTALDITTLRSFIKEFPTLTKDALMIFGPDADSTVSDADAAAELAKNANLAAVVLRPFTVDDPTGAKLDRDVVNRALGRGPSKKALWIAEHGEECTAPFSSGLTWAQRLCTATRVGAKVILRELDLDAARDNSTPDLWISLLHKTLTSRGVLDARANGAANDLSISSHCAPTDAASLTSHPGSPVIRYDSGAVTVMAVNPTNHSLRVSLRVSGLGSPGTGIGIAPAALLAAADSGTLVHEFVLTSANGDLNSTSTLLNGSPLEMAPGGGIPVLSPRQLQLDSALLVSLPPRSVAFWVIPGAKARACLTPPASSDVAPAGSRLRPLSARDVELGVNLDGVATIPHDAELPKDAILSEAQDAESAESGELPLIKDLRRRMKKLPRTPSPRLSLPWTSPTKLRSNLELPVGIRTKPSKEPESKALEDFLSEELKLRPKTRTAFDVPKLTNPFFDESRMMDPLRSGLSMDNDAENVEGSRKKRSADDAGGLYHDEDNIEARSLDDEFRYKREKTVMDYMKEDLQRKHKKTPPEETEKWLHSSEDDLENVKRSKRHHVRVRRFVPEESGLRLKRKLAVPDLLNLPKLQKKPILSPAAKRAQMLLSLDGPQGQKNDETAPNAWGSANREVFPQGDVFAETEGAYIQKPRDIDYVNDDDYLGLSMSRTPEFTPQGSHALNSPEQDRLYYAPGEFYDSLVPKHQRPESAARPIFGELGELEHVPGRISHSIDDAHEDGLRIVPAVKPSKEQEAQLQTKIREDLERHYADVQKVAADQRAETQSDEEEDVTEPPIDLEKLRLLGEKYIKENKMTLPDEVVASANDLNKHNETKEAETVSDTKSRRRRDLKEPSLSPKADVSGVPPTLEHTPQMSQSRVTDDAWKRRQEQVQAFKEKMLRNNQERISPTPHQAEMTSTDNEIRRLIQSDPMHRMEKRAVKMDELPTADKYYDESHGSVWQAKPTQRYNPVSWDSTGAPLNPSMSETKIADLWPFSSYSRMGERNDQDSYSLVYPQPLIDSFPPGQLNEELASEAHGEAFRSRHPSYNHPSNTNRYFDRRNYAFGRSSSLEDDSSCSSEESLFQYGPYEPYYGYRSSGVQESKTFPSLVAVPWDPSLPRHIMYKRSVDDSQSDTANTLVEDTHTPAPDDEIADAIRKLHKVLNEEDSSSKESVEVHTGQTLIDSPEAVDSLEDTIQMLLNMTKQLNDTLNNHQDHQDMISWSEFGLDDTSPESPRLDPEEAKFRDAAVAWLQAVKEGTIRTSKADDENQQNNGTQPNHLSVKKQLPGEESAEVVAAKLIRQRKLTEQENIISAMMQRVSALLSDLRSIFNKKQAE